MKGKKLFYILAGMILIAGTISVLLLYMPKTIEKEKSTPSIDIVEKIVNDMTISDMIYQMMFVTPESITNVERVTKAGETTKNALKKYPVGGIVYFSENFISRDQTKEMIKNTQEFSKIPLFIGVDEEGGRVSRLGKNPAMGVTKFPPMKKIGEERDLEKAYKVGETLANDLKAIGFNVNFAPDADVTVNENNTEIGDRSFGSDPYIVSEMVKNVVEGMQNNGVSATIKHFPGHGSTYKNSHNGYSESARTKQELQNCELLPFKEGIKAGVDFIMVSHMTLVNVCEEKVPSSISKEIITDMLITELGYEGIIITDSFSMGAVTKMYSDKEAAVKAVKAGADMILIPQNPLTAHDAIYEAVKKGEITKERIEKSVRKILELKKEKKMLG